jgi:hypothetical protein
MAVESDLAFLFMKWNRIDLMLARNPTDADDEEWEKQWRDNVAGRFDRVSGLLTAQPFDSFLSQNGELLKNIYVRATLTCVPSRWAKKCKGADVSALPDQVHNRPMALAYEHRSRPARPVPIFVSHSREESPAWHSRASRAGWCRIESELVDAARAGRCEAVEYCQLRVIEVWQPECSAAIIRLDFLFTHCDGLPCRIIGTKAGRAPLQYRGGGR